MNLKNLAIKYGTPLYVYDLNQLKSNIEDFTSHFPLPRYRAKYACKALTNPSILSFMQQFPIGIDAVSLGEIKLAIKAGFNPNQILFTPNCAHIDEIIEAIHLGVDINIDNLPQLKLIGQKYGNTLPISVRINPHIMAGGHYKISTGHIGSKFGISIHQMHELQALIKEFDLKIKGLHMHTGSDILDTQVFIQGADILFRLAADFPDIEFLDLGSGFKVAYQEGSQSTDLAELSCAINHKLTEFEYLKKVEIWFEPGKWLVSNIGYLIAEVTVVKPTPSTLFAGLNTGFHHLIRPMLYDAYHHITNLSNPDKEPKPYTIVGQICETDTFASDRLISEISTGDFLCFHNAGAYSFSMSSQYNSRLRPAEIAVYNDMDYIIRKAEILDDLTRNATEVIIHV